MRRVSLLLLLLLFGCGSSEENGPSQPAPPGAPEDALVRGGTILCEPTGVALSKHPFNLGKGAFISGSFRYEGTTQGEILLESVRVKDDRRTVIFHHTCGQNPGRFKAEMPPDLGEVWLVAFLDPDGDGPEDDEPAGRLPQPVAITDGLDVGEIRIQDAADIGEFAPSRMEPTQRAGRDLPHVVVGGIISRGKLRGPILLQVLAESEGVAKVLFTERVGTGSEPEPGVDDFVPFRTSIAQDLPPVWLVVFVDIDGDGPDPDDPAGSTPRATSPTALGEGLFIEVKPEGGLSALKYPFSSP